MIDNIVFRPIGMVKSVFKNSQVIKSVKIDTKAAIVLFDEYVFGLEGLDGFSHIIVVFNFHLSKDFKLIVKPPRHNPKGQSVGVFATHSPFRPNAIGISIVELLGIEKNRLFIKNKDILDGSPVIDIKPYIPEKIDNVRLGWFISL